MSRTRRTFPFTSPKHPARVDETFQKLFTKNCPRPIPMEDCDNRNEKRKSFWDNKNCGKLKLCPAARAVSCFTLLWRDDDEEDTKPFRTHTSRRSCAILFVIAHCASSRDNINIFLPFPFSQAASFLVASQISKWTCRWQSFRTKF